MDKNVVLDILKAIENLLYYNDMLSAKEYVKLEIDNLEGNTPRECKSHFSNFYYCDKCTNRNCPDNKIKTGTKLFHLVPVKLRYKL